MRPEEIDALLEAQIVHNGPRCKIAGLTGTARAVFDRALERDDIPESAVARAIASLGVSISRGTIARHRAKECTSCRGT
mgnify:CR=1 FL=1